MSTPFDNKIWKLFHTGLISNSLTPEPIIDPSKNKHTVQSYPGTLDMSPQPQYHPPLRSHSHFEIKFCDKGTIKIQFKDAPDYMQRIWEDAQNVYYDPYYFVCRGDLMYNKETGLPAASFGNHFVIAFKGQMGIGGSLSQLTIDFFDEPEIVIPSDDLDVAYATKGGWRADEVADH